MTEQQELIPIAVGEFLKQKRMAKKISLAAIAKAINLDEVLLGKIENDEAGHIASVYRNGYIQSYARYLQIPPEEISKLSEQVVAEEATLRTVFSEPPKRNPVDNWLRASSYVLASLLIGTLAWQFTHEAVRLSQNAPGLNDGQAKLVPVGGASQQQQELAGPVSASIASLDALHAGSGAGAGTTTQALTTSARATLPVGEGRLQVSVSADSWVEISDANGRELEMDLLRGGSQKNYQGKLPFRILIGRASAARLSLNGESVDMTAFISDDVAQMIWPQKLQAQELQAMGKDPGED